MEENENSGLRAVAYPGVYGVCVCVLGAGRAGRCVAVCGAVGERE